MKKIVFKFLVAVICLVVIIIAFYKFMTYDRIYSWSKDLEFEAEKIAGSHGFELVSAEEVAVDSIKLPSERRAKILIQKELHKIGLMNYGREFGQSLVFESKDSTEKLVLRAWCLSDHVMGIEIQIRTKAQTDLANLKQDIKNHFDHYDILWSTLRQ